MRLVSLSEQTGSYKSLVPKGYNLSTIPNDLFNALDHAFMVLYWRKNLGEDETPPEWMWHLDWEIEAWFKKVKIERERKWGNPSSSSSGHDDDSGDELFDDNIFFERAKRGEPLFE